MAVPAAPPAWKTAIETALGPGAGSAARLSAIRRAVRIARGFGPHDTRLAFSLFALGKIALGRDPHLAAGALAEAGAIYLQRPDTRLQAAFVGVQASAYALSSGNPAEAIRIADANSPVALGAENPNLLSSFLLIKAQALDVQGRKKEAGIVRLDGLGWARYGMANDRAIRRRLAEIAALAPRAKSKGS